MPEPDDDKKPRTDDERSAARASELAVLMDTHRDNVKQANEMYPTPPGAKFSDMSPDEQRRHNARRAHVDSANTAYCRSVRLACARHRDEDLAERAKFTATWQEKMEAEAKAPASVSNDDRASPDKREGADQ